MISKIWISSFLILCGCASKPILSVDCSPGSRNPSSLACENIFRSDEIITSENSSFTIQKIEGYFKEIEYQYGKSFSQLKDYSIENVGAPIFADQLYKDFLAGMNVSRILPDLGYRVDEIIDPREPKTKVKVLRSNANLVHFYERIYTRILSNLKQGMKFEELILPALVFQRKTGETEQNEFILSRPGIDPVPDPTLGWKIAEGDLQLPADLFALNVSEGKMVLASGMWNHDIIHLADYISAPKLMKAHRAYFKLFYQLSINKKLKAAHRDSGNYLNEFLIFPKLKYRNKLLKLIQRNQLSPRISKEARIDQLRDQLATGELLNRIDEIEKMFFKTFEFHGGGVNDGNSLNRIPAVHNYIMQQLKRGVLSVDHDSIRSHLVNNSFWGLFQQIVILKKLISGETTLLKDGSFYEANLKSEDRQKMPWLLTQLMFKFEFLVENSLGYKMSAESLFEDLVSKEFRKTRSYQYFKNVAPSRSLEYELFVNGKYIPYP